MPFQDYTTNHGGDLPLQSPLLPPAPPKPETRVLSVLLKVVIMILLTTLFFVFLGLATALLLIHLCIASALHRRRRQRHTQFPNSSSGLSSRDLKKLSQFRLSKWVKPQSQIECAICLDGFREGQWCRRLGGCGHVYHRKCVDAWLVKVPACPLCRTSVRLDFGDTGLLSDVEEHEVNEFRAFGRQQSNWSVW